MVKQTLAVWTVLLGATAVWANPCCDTLKKHLPLDTIFPFSNVYSNLNNARWSQTAILTPSCIFHPSSAETLSRGMTALIAANCPFSIKSGGHMQNPGANNMNDGVAIDLTALNSVELSADKHTVSLGAGGTWQDSYRTAGDQGVLWTGGLCGTTGVGGVSLGGGMSLFQAARGWVVDNVLNYELVLASGRVVNANQTNYPDLFRALKGGGSNFGVVTRVDLPTFEQGNIWGGVLVVPALPSVVDATLDALTNFTAANAHEDNVNAGAQVVFVYFANETRIVDIAVGTTDGKVDPEFVQGFTALQPQVLNTLATKPLLELVEEANAVQPFGYRDLGASITFANDLETLQLIQNATDAAYLSVKDLVPDMDWVHFYVPQPKSIQVHSSARGGNSLGIESVKHDQMIIFISPRWHDPAHDDIMYAVADRWTAAVTDIARAQDKYDPFIYLNFAGPAQRPICSYGEENVAFLKKVAREYDPEGVFQRLVPGGFKLGDC